MNNWGAHREVEKVKNPPRQISVAQLPEHQQDAAMREVDEAREKFPSVLVAGHLLHVCQMGSTWEVWLNCEDTEFTGLCVSVGVTRDAAIAEAVRVFEAVVEKLQEPVL